MAEEKRQILPARHELKYFINPAELIVLRSRLDGALDRDSHSQANGGYHIRSLYFDDVYDSAYRDKLDGIEHRDKYRIRIYNLSDKVIFMERKRKEGDLIRKSSVRITRRLAEQIISGDPTGLNLAQNDLIKDVYAMMRTRLLRPAVIVDYRREAFTHPAENTRITFDTDISTCPGSIDLFNAELLTVPAVTTGKQVLEVKYDDYLPSHIAGLLTGLVCERSAISKYTLCRRYSL